ncbi:DUF2497 domain-containing protein [Sandaracinobacteroides hominis]|uniref:DUF2497 domain-containing protein n=1 Tax=Sandaracinobacteroides hominis TaxID=2780086 RepID=UPI0018F77ED9|nr:DUF2497 domain-containing protein [Sandaracinobacteroides hominis]
MTRKTLDPNLASILDSIRATVGGETAPQAIEAAEAEPAETPAPRATAKGSKKAAAAAPVAAAPVPPAQHTVEEFLAELIRPQVKAWLNAHLPEIIQKMAADEIARLTGR